MLRIISDVHGNRREYLEIISQCEHSLQLGDLGFYYDFLNHVSAKQHKFFVGNHDNHDDKYKYRHCLWKYGDFVHGGIEFFFLEGGFSIDYKIRLENERLGIWPQTWWREEELPQNELNCAIAEYSKVKPDVLISHEAPRSLVHLFSNPKMLANHGFPADFTTRTSEALDRMLEAHRPKLHIFGHFHYNFDKVIDGTRFICQEELGYLDLNEDLTLRKFSYYAGVEYA